MAKFNLYAFQFFTYLVQGALVIWIASAKDKTALDISYGVVLFAIFLAARAPITSAPTNLVKFALLCYAIWGLFFGAWVPVAVAFVYLVLVDFFFRLLRALLIKVYMESPEVQEASAKYDAIFSNKSSE